MLGSQPRGSGSTPLRTTKFPSKRLMSMFEYDEDDQYDDEDEDDEEDDDLDFDDEDDEYDD